MVKLNAQNRAGSVAISQYNTLIRNEKN